MMVDILISIVTKMNFYNLGKAKILIKRQLNLFASYRVGLKYIASILIRIFFRYVK